MVYLLRAFGNKFPDFTNTGTVFGLILLSSIPTSWVMSFTNLSSIGYFQEFLMIRTKIIRNQLKNVRGERFYEELRDGVIAEFVFGSTTLIMGLIFFNYSEEFILGFTGINLTFDEVIKLLGAVILFIIGGGLILKSFLDTKNQKDTIFSLIINRNFLYYPKSNFRDSVLKALNPFLVNSNWEGLKAELQSVFLLKSIENIKGYDGTLMHFINQLESRKEIIDKEIESLRLFGTIRNTNKKTSLRWIDDRYSKGYRKYTIDNKLLIEQDSILHLLLGKSDIVSKDSKRLNDLFEILYLFDDLVFNLFAPIVYNFGHDIQGYDLSNFVQIDITDQVNFNPKDFIAKKDSIGTTFFLIGLINSIISNGKKDTFYIADYEDTYEYSLKSIDDYISTINDNLSDKNLDEILQSDKDESYWTKSFYDRLNFLKRIPYVDYCPNYYLTFIEDLIENGLKKTFKLVIKDIQNTRLKLILDIKYDLKTVQNSLREILLELNQLI